MKMMKMMKKTILKNSAPFSVGVYDSFLNLDGQEWMMTEACDTRVSQAMNSD